MSKENCGGEIVKEWDNFFLRDDSKIRCEEVYSLFRKNPYNRIEVYNGELKWAISMAESTINITVK